MNQSKMANNNSIAKGAIISYISIFLNIVISLVYTPWMIKKVGISDYGLYGLVGAFLSYFMLDFGLSSSITRFIAKYRAEDNEEKVANMLGLTAKVYLVFDSVIFVILLILYFFLSNVFGGLTPYELERLKVLYCISGVFSILSFLFKPVSGAMMAYEYFVENKFLDLVVRVGTVILIVGALLLNGNVYHVVFITGAVWFVVSVSRYIVFAKKSRVKINWKYFEKSELVALFSFSAWILLVQLSQMLRLSSIPTILGMFSNTTEISVFTVGKNLEGMVYTIAAALNGLFLPVVSRMIHSGDKKGIMDLLIKVGRIQLFIIFLIFSGFFAFGERFLNLWVGEDFHSAYFVFLSLVFVNIFTLTLQIAMDMVYAENKVKHTATRVLFSSLLGMVLSIIVAPKYGAVGCATATGVCMVFTQILYVNFYRKEMGLNMRLFFYNCHLRILPILSLYSITAYFIQRYVPFDGWAILLFMIAVYSIGYFVITWFFLASTYEKKLLLSIIPYKKKRN